MTKDAFIKWKRFWLKNYKEQYKKSNVKEKKELKQRVYKDINFTDNQKDDVWESIVRCEDEH